MMTTPPETDLGGNGCEPRGPLGRGNRRIWYLALAAIILLATAVVAAMIGRSRAQDRDEAEAARQFANRMPAGFEADGSPEANAFRDTCSRCHLLPSPSIYDEEGWRQVGRRMATQITARAMQFPDGQLDLAITYAIKHGQQTDRPVSASRPR